MVHLQNLRSYSVFSLLEESRNRTVSNGLLYLCLSLDLQTEGTGRMDAEMVVHNGGCHCKSVRWRVRAPATVVAWQCNCSNRSMRGNTHFMVPCERFELLGDSKLFLTTYTFGTHTAKHTFCKICGITSFFTPRLNPDDIAVTFGCVVPGTLKHVEIKQFDGKNLKVV